MSIFTIQSPDGRKIRIEAVDQATAIRGAQEWVKAHPAQIDMSVSKRFKNKPGPGPLDFVSQGMSGLNEGIATAMGAPVDIATAGINLAVTGINRVAGTSIPQIEKPIGGSERIRDGMFAPTIGPESSDPALRATRRVMQEVGAWSVPGGGVVSRAARPLKTAAHELTAAIGSGTGAAIAEQVAPGNAGAELAGQVLGSLTPAGAARTVSRPKRAPVLTVEDLRAAKNAAYEKTRQMGVAFQPAAYDDMLVKIVKKAQADGISPDRHRAAVSFIRDMMGKRGKPMSLTELDQLRQMVRRDLIVPSYGNQAAAADAYFGEQILDEIDDLIDTAPTASAAIREARELNTRLRKSELLEDAVERAKLQAASSGSGGNINNAIRQQIKGILNNPKRLKPFSAAERAAMDKLVKQGKADDLIRLLSKAAPGNNGLIGVIELLATIHNPAAAAVPLAGMVAKGFADRGTLNKADALREQVMTGQQPRPFPKLPMRLSPSLLYAQGANQMQNGPLEITVQGGSAR